MIVVVIIAILAAISIPIYANQQKAAAVATLKTDLKNAATAIQTVATANKGQYPTSLPETVTVSEGNTLYLSVSNSANNLAAGQTNGLGSVNEGRVGQNNSSLYSVSTVDGYKRITYKQEASNSGPYWDYVASVPKGTQVTVSLTVRSSVNYKGFWLSLEKYNTSSGHPSVDGAKVDLVAGEWQTITTTLTTNTDNITKLTLITYAHGTFQTGDTFGYKNPIIVLGDTIDTESISSTAGE